MACKRRSRIKLEWVMKWVVEKSGGTREGEGKTSASSLAVEGEGWIYKATREADGIAKV